MRFFLDTANLDEVAAAARLGVVSGVTTNPTLLAKARLLDVTDAVRRIAAHVKDHISVEVTATTAEAMCEEGKRYAALTPQVVIKVPMTAVGLEAVSRLSAEGIRTNVTLVFTVNQALLAARAGAAFVSLFVGRLDDVSHDGAQLIRDTAAVFRAHGIASEIIAASIRHPRHVTEAALAGAHIATVPFKVLEQMIGHPLTESGVARFAKDWEQAQLTR